MRNLLIGYVLALALLLGSCADETSSTQIPPEEMAEILKQIHLADGWVDQKGGTLERRQAMRNEIYDEVLAQYGYEKEEFYAAYRYYTDRPIVLDSIYTSIIAYMEAELEAERKANLERRRKDGEDRSDDTLRLAPNTPRDTASAQQPKPKMAPPSS